MPKSINQSESWQSLDMIYGIFIDDFNLDTYSVLKVPLYQTCILSFEMQN